MKMRNNKFLVTIALLGSIMLLGGCNCIFQDEDDCPPSVNHNLVLHFNNTDNDGKEIFNTSIDKVDIFLFDINDKLKYQFEASKNELIATQTATLSVEPGDYRVVCWGNAKENTICMLEKGESISDGCVYKHIPDGETPANGNPLYHAPYNHTAAQRFTVEPDERKTVDVRFRSAHIKFKFTVKNYATVMGETNHPYIELTNLFPRYDFTMCYLPTPAVCYMRQTSPENRITEDITYTRFNTPRFNQVNPIEIKVRKEASTAPLKTFALTDVLEDLDINVENQVECTLAFTIDFAGGDVKISISKWEGSELEPGIE